MQVTRGQDTAAGHPAEEDSPPPPDHLDWAVDAVLPLMSVTSNHLTILFQGNAHLFDSVTPEKVQAVLLLLGESEVPAGLSGMALSCHSDQKGLDVILQPTVLPAKRIASLLRFCENEEEQCLSKKLQYAVCEEDAPRIKRRKVQFAGKTNLDKTSTSNGCDRHQSSSLDDSLHKTNCQNCGISSKLTPGMRRGPAGSRTLCNACGLVWRKKGILRTVSKDSTMGTQSPVQNDLGGPNNSDE